ncbi:MAG: redox-regulated ATPase YchF [Bacillota bacterium]|nr:redox-regulated ATPase YchF [Bacillota bacterium]
MKLGIVGLPNVGKSTLFNALTEAGAEVANYPYCTIEPNVGVVAVPDRRLDWLCDHYHPVKRTPATIEFVDIAGLIAGASQGEGLGNQFLANIREVDAVVHVVRCFEDENVIHVSTTTDAARDIDVIDIELMLADLEHIERRRERLSRQLKGDRSVAAELELAERISAALEAGKPARSLDFEEDELPLLRNFSLLTLKPILYVANVSEDMLAAPMADPHVQAVARAAARDRAAMLAISAAIEMEIASLPPNDREAFLADLGLEESGLVRMIQAGYRLLELISFLTTGEDEVRAWTVRRGTKAPQAAGKIHSDFERGFIRAEIVSFADLERLGSVAAAREHGVYRSEGRDYVVQDGDVIHFRFNV